MISVEEAERHVREHVTPCATVRVPVGDAHGLVLHEQIVCSTDSPPFDKSQVDGFALRSADVAQADVVLRIVDEVMAGQMSQKAVTVGSAIRIMTGAPIPAGADAVVMVERTELVSFPETAGDFPATSVSPSVADQSSPRWDRPAGGGTYVRVLEKPRRGQNILLRGESMRSGDVVLQPGHLLRGIEIGLLAEMGVTAVWVSRRPTVAIISTGNELVPVEQTPQPGQIRNSNGPMLEALVREAGGQLGWTGIARDTQDELTAAIHRGLASDVIVLSGGVSAGVLDLVPSVLQQLGVTEVFHKVHLKPGKPLWFGVRRDEHRKQLVFGLPGNPVSSLVCFHLFVRPALAALAGRTVERGEAIAKLAVPFRQRGDRPTFFPARTRHESHDLMVEPLSWRGSADLRTLVDANALICFGPGEYELPANTPITVRLL